MTLQYLFEYYMQYWWAMFPAAAIAHFIMMKTSCNIWDDDWNGPRFPTFIEAISMAWYNRDMLVHAWIALSILTAFIFWLAPYFINIQI